MDGDDSSGAETNRRKVTLDGLLLPGIKDESAQDDIRWRIDDQDASGRDWK